MAPRPWPPEIPLCLLVLYSAPKPCPSIPRPPLPARSPGACSRGLLARTPALPGGLHSHVRPMQVAQRAFLRSLLPSQPLSQREGCSHGGGGNICVVLLEEQHATWHLFWTSPSPETFPILLFLYMLES